MSYITEDERGVFLAVRVQPRASDNRLAGVTGDMLKIRLTAPPVEGEANVALIDFLAEKLGFSRSMIKLIRGHTGRSKLIWVEGATKAVIEEKLNVNSPRHKAVDFHG